MEETSSASPEPRSLALIAVSVLVFLVPVLVIPFGGAPFLFSKTVLVALLAFVLLASFTVRTLKRGSLEIPWSWLSFTIVLLPTGYLISAIFSSHPALSFWGYQLDPDTFGFIALASGAALLVSLSVRVRAKIIVPFLAFLFSAWVVFLFQLIQIFFGAPFPTFIDVTSNLIGSWNEFGIFAGLVASLTLLVVAALPLSRIHYTLISATLAVALFFLVIVNFTEVWVAIAAIAFVMLVYTLTSQYFMRPGSGSAQHVILPSIILALALFFAFAGGGTASALQNALSIRTLDVRPSIQGTLAVLEGVYRESPLVGSGPNTFNTEWLKYRPKAVITTPFWGTHFNAGSGAIPTAASVGGIVVGLAWLILLVALVYTAVRALIIVPVSGDRIYFLTALAALGATYLAVMHVLYAPGSGTTIMFFIMLGLLIASLKDSPLARSFKISFSASPRIGFLAVLAILLFLVAGLGALYGIGQTYASTVLYNHAVATSNTGDFNRAQSFLAQALAFAKEDQYYRAASVVDLARLSSIIQSGKVDAVTQTDFRDTLTSAVKNANAAVEADPARFENWLIKADVYGTAVPLRIEGAYDNTIAALESAQKLSPLSPEVDFRMAQAMAGNGDTSGARTAIITALEKKADYTDAILLLAQIELSDGNLGKAIDSVKAAVYFEPTNVTLLYQLGVLLIANREYQDAATALEAALSVDSSFANAKFYLAEAYAFLKRTDEAVKLMTELASQNPGNTVVSEYRTLLEAGTNPFLTSTTPPDSNRNAAGLK